MNLPYGYLAHMRWSPSKDDIGESFVCITDKPKVRYWITDKNPFYNHNEDIFDAIQFFLKRECTYGIWL